MNGREGISSLNFSATMGLELCVSQGNISLKLLLLQLRKRKQDRTRHARRKPTAVYDKHAMVCVTKTPH